MRILKKIWWSFGGKLSEKKVGIWGLGTPYRPPMLTSNSLMTNKTSCSNFFSTASFLDFLEAVKRVTEGQQFHGQHFTEGCQITQNLVNGIALKLGLGLVAGFLEMYSLLKILQTWKLLLQLLPQALFPQ